MVEFIFNDKNPIKTNTKIVMLSSSELSYKDFLTIDEEASLLDAIAKQKFEGKLGSFVEVYNGRSRIIAIGCGKSPNKLDIQTLGGKLIKKIQDEEKVAIFCGDFEQSNLNSNEVAFNLALGIELGGYRFDKYFTKKKEDFYPKIETIEFVNQDTKFDTSNFYRYQSVANAVRYARDLANEPANYLTPEVFAEDIKRLEYLGLEVDILDEKKIKNLGMGMLLSVSKGSANAPRVAVIKWNGKKDKKEFSLGMVGKGVTFDSGGISIKPSAGMEDMKGDMTGAAVVAATMKAVALSKLNINIIAVVGLVENMPSGTASRPGDIVTSMSGQTVEIINTDAEGRLVLGDCLWYLQEKYDPKVIIDVATLTGSTMMTFGFEYAGLFSNHDGMSEDLMQAGQRSGEKLWRLPINEEYNKLMDSSIADMKNSGSRLAGGITAACFLQRFIKEENCWAHLDIAGVDKDDKGHPLTPKGATGFGVRLLYSFITESENK